MRGETTHTHTHTFAFYGHCVRHQTHFESNSLLIESQSAQRNGNRCAVATNIGNIIAAATVMTVSPARRVQPAHMHSKLPKTAAIIQCVYATLGFASWRRVVICRLNRLELFSNRDVIHALAHTKPFNSMRNFLSPSRWIEFFVAFGGEGVWWWDLSKTHSLIWTPNTPAHASEQAQNVPAITYPVTRCHGKWLYRVCVCVLIYL